MRPSKYLNDPTLTRIVDQIVEGTMTRQQAAESLNISVATFNTRLIRAKMNHRIGRTRVYSGDHLFKPDPDKAKAYEEALRFAAEHPSMKVTKLHERFPDLSYQILARKVKERKAAAADSAPAQ